jgi:hypothetical protein
MVPRLVFGEEMGKRKYSKKAAASIIIAVTVVIAIIATYRVYHPARQKFYSKEISPGQTYVAWDGNPPPSGYVFHAIYYDMYINASVVYGSGTNATSWTCPEYVYGQEGKPEYKVDYALAWTDGYAGT